LSGSMPQLKGKVPNGVVNELRRQYYEIANSANAPAMAALMALVPMSQILLGSDYPYVPIGATVNGLKALGLSPEQVAQISRGNALQLLPRLS